MTAWNEDIESMRASVEVIVRHVAEHADFRGRIKRLDKECTICQRYFTDEFGKL
jgi:hypothetical protein